MQVSLGCENNVIKEWSIGDSAVWVRVRITQSVWFENVTGGCPQDDISLLFGSTAAHSYFINEKMWSSGGRVLAVHWAYL